MAAMPPYADPAGDALARRIHDRPSLEGRVGRMMFELTNARGAVRRREALLIHADRGDSIRIAIYFSTPANIRNTAFLSLDHDAQVDQAWLYLPATQRVRQIPSADRGDYFMGTDITYGEIRDDFRFGLQDWVFSAHGTRSHNGGPHQVLRGQARNERLAQEMGYSRFEALIDDRTLFPVVVTFFDAGGAPLKRVSILDQQQIGGAWTAMRFRIENMQTGHRTDVRFEDMRQVEIPDSALDASSLAFGPPRLG
jgi:hypothetical protein